MSKKYKATVIFDLKIEVEFNDDEKFNLKDQGYEKAYDKLPLNLKDEVEVQFVKIEEITSS